MKPDFGATATDYAEHRAGFPDSLFDRLAKLGLGRPGQDVLDLGTGTGSLGRGFARRGCNVVGLDPAEPLLAKAKELDAREGIQTEYHVGRAENTGLPDSAFDVVAAGQCWHWFNRAQAATEAARLKSAPDSIRRLSIGNSPFPAGHATSVPIEVFWFGFAPASRRRSA